MVSVNDQNSLYPFALQLFICYSATYFVPAIY